MPLLRYHSSHLSSFLLLHPPAPLYLEYLASRNPYLAFKAQLKCHLLQGVCLDYSLAYQQHQTPNRNNWSLSGAALAPHAAFPALLRNSSVCVCVCVKGMCGHICGNIYMCTPPDPHILAFRAGAMSCFCPTLQFLTHSRHSEEMNDVGRQLYCGVLTVCKGSSGVWSIRGQREETETPGREQGGGAGLYHTP